MLTMYLMYGTFNLKANYELGVVIGLQWPQKLGFYWVSPSLKHL